MTASDGDSLKLTLSVFIFVFGVCGVLTPRLFDPFGSKITYSNLVSCGVIISAALVHLLNDATTTLNAAPLPKLSGGRPYPWSFMICGLSFILLFFFERLLIHKLLHNHHHHGHDHSDHHHHTHGDEHDDDDIDTVINTKMGGDHHHHKHHHNDSESNHSPKNKNHRHRAVSAPLIAHQHHDHHHGVVREHAEDMVSLLNQKNYFSSIILMMGLGLHSVLSGVALGSSTAESEAISLGVAILSHKYLASFAVGVPLNKSCISLSVALCIAFAFSMLTPIGILIGFLLQNSFSSNPWISDCLICVAAGTFLYVSICEILVVEFSEDKKIERKLYQSMNSTLSLNTKQCADECDTKHCKPKQDDQDELKKMACVLVGFAIMSTLAVWV